MDESGDTGFKFGEGSSAYFVIMLVMINNVKITEQVSQDIDQIRTDLHWAKEFHFNKCPDRVRTVFLQTMARHPLKFRAIVVPKARIYTDFLRHNNQAFYQYMTRLVLEHDNGMFEQAKLFIDKRGNKIWHNELATYLRKMVNTENRRRLIAVRHKDWKENPLIQVADMYSGALYRWATHGHRQFYRIIEHQKDDVWYFR